MITYKKFMIERTETIMIVGITAENNSIPIYQFYHYNDAGRNEQGIHEYAKGHYLIDYEERLQVESYSAYKELFEDLCYKLLYEKKINDILYNGFYINDISKSMRNFLISYTKTPVELLNMIAGYLEKDYISEILILLDNPNCSEHILKKYINHSWDCISNKSKKKLNERIE